MERIRGQGGIEMKIIVLIEKAVNNTFNPFVKKKKRIANYL